MLSMKPVIFCVRPFLLKKSVNDMDFLYKMKNRLSDMDSLGQEPKRMSKYVLSLGCVRHLLLQPPTQPGLLLYLLAMSKQ